jgi:hypothetical protein
MINCKKAAAKAPRRHRLRGGIRGASWPHHWGTIMVASLSNELAPSSKLPLRSHRETTMVPQVIFCGQKCYGPLAACGGMWGVRDINNLVLKCCRYCQHPPPRPPTHTHPHTHPHTRTHPRTHTHAPSHTHANTLTHPHLHTQTHTPSHTPTPSYTST